MITVKSYFEKNHVRAQVVGFDQIGNNSEKFVYSTPITLYSGVNNPIKIQCLNSDQKSINVADVTIQAGLFAPGTQNELILLTATDIDSANGIVQVNFTPAELAPLDFGFFEFTLIAADNTGNVWPVYIDDNYGSRLSTTLAKGPVLAYPDPIAVTFTDQTDVGVCSDQIDLSKRPMNSTLATLEANLVSYTGNITAQGSLVTIPTPIDWANISSAYYSNVSGLVFQSVSGSYAQLRFVLNNADPHGWGNLNASTWITGGNIRI